MPDSSKLEKLNRELEKSEKKLRKAINDEKALQHQLKQLTRKERTHRLCTRGGRFAVSATGGAHLCSIQYYLRFWLGICRTSLAVSALRIMRYCLCFLFYLYSQKGTTG